jgi:diguanylate cyclase (GGDEF)-like protein
VFGRLGGEEFALLLPETSGNEAVAVAERLREAIAEHAMPLPAGSERRVTASFGIAELSPAFGSPAAWIETADAMLYAAKSGGRNCSRLAEKV